MYPSSVRPGWYFFKMFLGTLSMGMGMGMGGGASCSLSDCGVCLWGRGGGGEEHAQLLSITRARTAAGASAV